MAPCIKYEKGLMSENIFLPTSRLKEKIFEIEVQI